MADEQRDIEEFRTSGLLWLVNRSVFHPRGFALAFHYDDDGDFTGWSLLGDGSQPFAFDHDFETKGGMMLKANETLRPHGERLPRDPQAVDRPVEG